MDVVARAAAEVMSERALRSDSRFFLERPQRTLQVLNC